MKKWFRKNRGLLIAISISLIFIYLCGLWFLSLVVKNQNLVMDYYETGKVATNLNCLLLPLGLIIFSGLVFIVSSLIIFLRIMFPNSKAFNSLTLKSDRDFLTNLPKNIRKEVVRNE
ncbi:hypothetical protein PT201_08215 [Erysipelothrix rhusiopathiae]|nr:hypothetical protein [Erysipelothrix rhusiopathiae]